nr:ATP-binding protein [Streptomyces oceani]
MPSPADSSGAGGSRARHGREPEREHSGDAAVRYRMVRLALLPAGLVALVAAAAMAYVLHSQGGVSGSADDPGTDSATLWGVLAGSLLVTCAVLVGAALFASSEARTTVARYAALRRSSERGQEEVRAQLRRLQQGERLRGSPLAPTSEPSGDALDQLAQELRLAQHNAESAVAEAAELVRADNSGSDEKVEVFVNLARRLQSLVHREIELLDGLENQVEDPDLLKGLFHVDHLATRIRRHAENLAVLGGAVSRRQWTRPVTMTEVLRSSIAEVEQYPRVKLVPPIEGTLRGHAVADVIHLLSELVENATVFSAPQTQVLLRAQHVTAGLAIEVEDRGLGMTAQEQNRMNSLLSGPEQFDVGELLSDGRIGLFVVSSLARRHGIVVQLQSNIYGGIQAVLVLPQAVLGSPEDSNPSAASASERSAASAASAVAQNSYEPSALAAGAPAQPAVQHAAVPATPQPTSAAPPEPGQYGQSQQPFAQPAQPVQPAQPERPRQPHIPAQSAAHTSAPPGNPPARQSDNAAPQRGRHSGDAGHTQANGDRPQLPRRRRQEHLAPELRDAPRVPTVNDEAESGHDPGLMAAFRRGTNLADDAEGTPNGTENSPYPGGDTTPAN